MCNEDNIVNTNLINFTKEINTEVLIKEICDILEETNSILSRCDFNIENLNESLIVRALNEAISNLEGIFNKYYNKDTSDVSIKDTAKVIIKNYSKSVKKASNNGGTLRYLVEERVNHFKLVEVEYGENTSKELFELELIKYCKLTYKSEIYCDYIAILKKILEGNNFTPMIIPNELQYRIAEKIYPQLVKLSMKLQQCLRELTSSNVRLLIGGKERIGNIVVNSIIDCFSIIEKKDTKILENLKSKLKIKD